MNPNEYRFVGSETPSTNSQQQNTTDAPVQTADSPNSFAFGLLKLVENAVKGDQFDLVDVLGATMNEHDAHAIAAHLKRVLLRRSFKGVEVTALDEPTYSFRSRRTHGAAKSLHVGQRFPTAIAASKHMGYQHNEVANRLSAARRRGENTATISGVTWSLCEPKFNKPSSRSTGE